MRPLAPPYSNEPPAALWHVSEDDSIEVFTPHVSATAETAEPLVWAVDSRHLPLYWFPRDCPRATFWADKHTAPADALLLHGSQRVHAIEGAWLERVRAARVLAYRLPETSFQPYPEAGGYWVSSETVVPLELVELGDLLSRHAEAQIELRIVPNLWPLWNAVVASTLEYSGMRLRNARPAK